MASSTTALGNLPVRASRFGGPASAAQPSVPLWVALRCGSLTYRRLLHNKCILLALLGFALSLAVLQRSIVTAGEGDPVRRVVDPRVAPDSEDIHGVRNNSKIAITTPRANVSESKSLNNTLPSVQLQAAPGSRPKAKNGKPTFSRTPIFTKEINYFAKKYNHSLELPDGAEFIAHVAKVFKRQWKQDHEVTEELRKDIRSALGIAGKGENLYLTKHNTPQGSTMIYYMAGKPARIANHIWALLPNNSVFGPDRFKRCSVIGSSGILKGSGCGKEIDKADFVFRFNLAPVKGFEMDVGTKTNFTTLNPTFIMRKMNSIKTKEDEAKLIDELRQFQESHLYLPGFAVSGSLRLLVKAAGVISESNVTKPVFGSPDHFLKVANLWRKTLDTDMKWPSTGLYAVSSLFDTCDQINVYGFWPFPKSITGKAVPYHYNNNVKPTKVHNFDKEFKTLFMLHNLGVINLHLSSC